MERPPSDRLELVHRRGRAPTHDPPREDVDDERDIHKAAPRRHKRQIGAAQLVRAHRRKVPLHPVQRSIGDQVLNRRAQSTAPHDAPQAEIFHQPSDTWPAATLRVLRGLAGLDEVERDPAGIANASSSVPVNSGPLSHTMVVGGLRACFSRSRTATTRAPGRERSTSMAGYSNALARTS